MPCGTRRIRSAFVAFSILAALSPAGVSTAAHTTLSEIPLPGGLASARQAIGERTAPDRAEFLVEAIERFYNTPVDALANPVTELRALVARLDACTRPGGACENSPGTPDVVPLPLTPAWWNEMAFRGRPTAGSLALAILQSRDAALLYWALMAVDEPTRLWIGEHPDFARAFAIRAPLFALIAPAVRIADGRLSVPGGRAAEPAWEAVVGAKVADPERFLHRLLDDDEGRLAAFYASLGRLTDEQVDNVLRLDARQSEAPDALRRLSRVFDRTARGWLISARPFSRQPVDPLWLLDALPFHSDGRLALPGDPAFWHAVFEARAGTAPRSHVSASPAEPLDPVWLTEEVFDAGALRYRIRGEQVLFAAGTFDGAAPSEADDVFVAVAGLAQFPMLVRTLQRLGISDPAVYRHAIDRADALGGIRALDAQARATAQFQGALALLAHAVRRHGVPSDHLRELVSSLAAIETSETDGYDGGLTRWIEQRFAPPGAAILTARLSADPSAREQPAGRCDRLEAQVLALLSGQSSATEIEWEGTKYRVDPSAAETVRLETLRGDDPLPYLAASCSLLDMADGFARGSDSSDTLVRDRAVFDRVARDVGCDPEEADQPAETPPPCRALAREARASLASRKPDPKRVAAALRRLADELSAAGVTELTYAVSLGEPDAGLITTADAAGRHDLMLGYTDFAGVRGPWRPASAVARPPAPWHVEGSLLGLDMSLAEWWFKRVSSKPPPAAPSVGEHDRHALAEVLVLIDAACLTDDARDTIRSAVRSGRARLAQVTRAEDLTAIAAAAHLDPIRRTLLPWVFDHDRPRLSEFLSPLELFWLGGGVPDRALDAWGAPARPRVGCLCLRFPDPAPRTRFGGHLASGVLMSALPDLNLRLAELLGDLRMPAVLLPFVLAPATLDVVNNASSRYADDLRGLVEYIQALSADRVEQYLALLTTGGPLVPIEPAAGDVTRNHP